MMDRLLDAVRDEVRARVRREQERAARRAREILEAAEAHAEELERAARRLGETRGAAVQAAAERDADAEIAAVLDGAFDRLTERFLRRVEQGLAGLRGTPQHEEALAVWAREAASRMDGPTDVLAAPADRERLFAALVEAGASDFQVLGDAHIKVGFVVRDLDGHTVADMRPAARVAEHADALRAMLRQAVGPRPESPGPESPGPEAPSPGGPSSA